MVFDPVAPPLEIEGFMKWYKEQTEWKEDHSYDNPDVSTPALKAWFLDMIRKYPAMNGPYATDDVEDDDKYTDYSIGKSVIYAAFAWSEAESAYSEMKYLAQIHKAGFFNASSEKREIWIPNTEGDYILSRIFK